MVALYRGISAGSRLIRWFNWSDYSHAAWLDDDDWTLYEAWIGTGVRALRSLHEGHTPGTRVDVFNDQLSDAQRSTVRAFLTQEMGKPYDLPGVLRFATRRPESRRSQQRWFCSELVAAAFEQADAPLLKRIPSYKVHPGLLAWSPRLDLRFGVVLEGAAA